jgi:excisionase family DNA binding protein
MFCSEFVMSAEKALYSPKQVAQALRVSESSVKRWCDQGLIKTARSAGGHRRVRSVDVIDFIRQSGHDLAEPESLGLKSVEIQPQQIENAIAPAVEALLKGNEQAFHEILTGLYFAKHPLSEIFDRVVAPAFHEIGARWECDDAEIYQERRSCEICIRSLAELRKLQSKPPGALAAIGGSLSNDIYQLPGILAELVLRDIGINATSLGTSIPASSLIAAIADLQPNLAWLSVAYIANESEFLEEFALISNCCAQNKIALVVGGRALTSGLRKQISYSAFCDTMKHLESFATTLFNSRVAKPPVTPRA